VTIGATNTAVAETGSIIVKTSLAIVHPDFVAATLANNIALLKLQNSATFSSECIFYIYSVI
jgi:hypothetical protein